MCRRKLVYFLILVLVAGLFVVPVSPVKVVAADSEEDWDIINEDFIDYVENGWSINKGSNATDETGSVTQGVSEVTIVETHEAANYAWRYLIKTGFSLDGDGYTFEFRAKVNAPGTVNGAGVRTDGKLIPVFLTYDGETGTVQNAMTDPKQSFQIDTSEFRVYRVVVDENFNYDVYVDDQYAWSGSWVSQSGGNLVKLGAESPVSSDMTVDYFRLSSKMLTPAGDAIDTSELVNMIHEAETLISQANIGEEPGSYLPDTVQILSSAIDDANEVLNSSTLTPSQVNQAVADLKRQIINFKRQIIPFPIDSSPPNFPVFHYEKVVIDPEEMNYNPTGEYDFPTVIKASDYFENPLGTYYMYYGPHDPPGGISLAYADSLDGEWTEYENNPIISNQWDPHYRVSHVASAHPIWNEDEQKLFMYFHGENTTTRLASSTDGIHFDYEHVVVTTADFHEISEASYARVFEYTIPNLDNKYIMLLMGNNKGSRKIYLAWSKDGREWETQRMPIISPINDGVINHQSNLSGAWYFPWEDRHFVSVHAGSGHHYMVEVGEYFNQEVHYDAIYRSSSGYPEYGRAASRTYIQDGDTMYMFYEVGQRGSTKIALAKSVSEEELQKLHSVNLTIQNHIMQLNQVTLLEIIAKRFNNEQIDNNELTIQYFSSDEQVISVENGEVKALQAGSAEVWVEVTLNDITLESNKLKITVREGHVWNIIDEEFDDYMESGWLINQGRDVSDATGSITQHDGYVTIVENREAANFTWRYLTKTEFDVPEGAYTFEVKAKVNEAGTLNVIGTRINGKAVNIVLTYDGEQGTVQNSWTASTESFNVNTSEYQVYRVVVQGSNFHVYVNGEYAWSDLVIGGQSPSNLVKLGAESPVSSNMDVDYFKLNTGTLIPDGETLPGEEPIIPLPSDFPVFRYEKVVIDPKDMKYNPTGEYDFPTVIKAADYFENPLGKYYMYYGPHDYPGGISLAYADTLDGEWTEYEHNPIISNKWEPHYEVTHVASAHPIWIEEEQKLFLYFHGENNVTRLATSEDGINFTYEGVVLQNTDFDDVSRSATSYARVFEYTIPSKGNKYIMLLMGHNAVTRNNHIYLAWSDDGRQWETQGTSFLVPYTDEEIDQAGSISGPWYFPWGNRHFVTFHAASGHQYLVEVGENFDKKIQHGIYYAPSSLNPENGRAASRSYITDDDGRWYMFYEAGQRGSTKIAMAVAIDREDLLKIYRTEIGIQSTTVSAGGSFPLEITTLRNNNQVIDNSETDIQYYSSNPDVVNVADGIVEANQAGTAEVWVEVSHEDVVVTSNRLKIEVRDEPTWDIVDKRFNDYDGWDISKGSNSTGQVIQGDGYITIKEDLTAGRAAYYYVTRSDFHVTEGDFTFESRVKVNDVTTGNEIGVRINSNLVSVYLTYDGEAGTIQNSVNNPTKVMTLDTTQYHDYRIIVREDRSFDVYVDGKYAWSDVAKLEEKPNLIKIGSDNIATTNMDVESFKMNTGALVPEIEEPDTEAPSVPQNLSGVANSSDSITLSWEASTDDVGVKGYKVYRDGTAVATVSEATYTDTGLAAATSYTYQVSAFDEAGNESELSEAIVVTTLEDSDPGTDPDPDPRLGITIPISWTPEHKLVEEDGSTWLEVNDERILQDARRTLEQHITFDLSDVDLITAGQSIGLQLSRQSLITLESHDKGIELVGKGLRLVIPAGSLALDDIADDVRIHIQDVGHSHPFAGYAPATTTFDITIKSGDQDVVVSGTIFVEFKLADISDSKLVAVYHYNEDQERWEYIGGTYDAQSHSIRFEAEHFSQYAAFEYTNRFVDVLNSHWAHDAIYQLAQRQIILGKSAETFEPEADVTRAEFVTMLFRMLGIETMPYSDQFADVVANDWYADILGTAYEIGIIAGDGVNVYPNAAINREEMATIVMRVYEKFFDHQVQGTEKTAFIDDQLISEWAKPAVAMAVELGIIQGKPHQVFDPQGKATRAEAATIIYRIMTN